ncbi:transposase [Streptomyces lasalocidi]
MAPRLGVWVRAEIGDDRTRFADARVLKAYAGSAPVILASGKKRYAGRRHAKIDRLVHAGCLWAIAFLRNGPGADAHHRRRRERGDRHASALGNLFNRMCAPVHSSVEFDVEVPDGDGLSVVAPGEFGGAGLVGAGQCQGCRLSGAGRDGRRAVGGQGMGLPFSSREVKSAAWRVSGPVASWTVTVIVPVAWSGTPPDLVIGFSVGPPAVTTAFTPGSWARTE